MALRRIRIEGDEILRKKSKIVTRFTNNIKVLVDDMLETMYNAQGIGLAAPQVGILKRILVIDIGEGPIVLINPEVIESEGEQEGQEGCLSIPGKSGEVKRAARIKVRGMDAAGKEYIIECMELLARALSHEIDHLDGKLFIDFAININIEED